MKSSDKCNCCRTCRYERNTGGNLWNLCQLKLTSWTVKLNILALWEGQHVQGRWKWWTNFSLNKRRTDATMQYVPVKKNNAWGKTVSRMHIDSHTEMGCEYNLVHKFWVASRNTKSKVISGKTSYHNSRSISVFTISRFIVYQIILREMIK